jgi:D-aspartate ligase
LQPADAQTWPADTSVAVVLLNLFTHCGVTAMRTLGRLGVPVYGFHGDQRAPSLRSRYCRGVSVWNIEREADDDSVTHLLDFAARFDQRPILIPTEDSSCLFVEDHAEELAEAYCFPRRPAGLARALSSKQGMYEACEQHGVPTPGSFFPRSLDEAREFAEAATFPIMVKGVDNREFGDEPGAGKVIAQTPRELLDAYQALNSRTPRALVFQEYIPGGPATVWMFNGYFDADSNCIFGATGKKLRQYPPYIGQTSLGLCSDNPQVHEIVRRFMKATHYTGILDIGFRYDARDGEYKLLDVNPRLGSAFRLFTGTNGMDVVRAQYLDLTGQDVPASEPCAGRKWIVENYDLAASAKYLRDGRLRPVAWARSFRGVEECAWFARDDLGPFAAMWSHSARYVLSQLRCRGRSDRWWRQEPPRSV